MTRPNNWNLTPISLGRVDYRSTYAAMQDFTATRSAETPDELWLCEHAAVYTQGLAGKAQHILGPTDIPVVQTNRGGQVTYHGPGQVVAYPLIDLKRVGYSIKEYVYRIEEAVLRTLAHFGVTGHRVRGAPGIYVRLDDPRSRAELAQQPEKLGSEKLGPDPEKLGSDPAAKRNGSDPNFSGSGPNFEGLGKIAALGIKVSHNCTYHGVALNVNMDLTPYSRIHPCGYVGLQTVDFSTIGIHVTWQEAADMLGQKLVSCLAP